MEIESIREKLHSFIDTMEDKKAKAMYALFEDDNSEYTDEFKAELDRRYEYYKNGGEMVSAEEVERTISRLSLSHNQ